MGQQISYLTVIVVHSTMHLMHHNHCQITTIYYTADGHVAARLARSMPSAFVRACARAAHAQCIQAHVHILADHVTLLL